jgi:hypothetical protein
VLVVLAFVVIAAVVWVFLRALQATSRLADARDDISNVRADLVAGRPADTDLAAAERDTAAARNDTHDVVWNAVSWLAPVHTVRGITSSLSTLAHDALPPLVQVGPSLQPSRLRVRSNEIALPPLVAAAPTIRQAADALATARAQVAGLPSGGIGLISKARSEVLSQLTSLTGSIDDASRFATVGPDMLGQHGLRRYFVGIQNNAETRATGGLVAAYAIVTADHGKIEVAARGNDSGLRSPFAPTYQPPAEYASVYGNYDPTAYWPSTNVSPNFPNAADNWAHLWEKQTGKHIDGSFGVDPYGLQAILGAVGPVKVSGYPGQYDGTNLAKFIEQGEYAAFPGIDNTLRKSFVSKVAGAVLDRLLSGSGDPQAIASALGRSAGQRHLALWSARPAEQAQISGTPLADELPVTSAPFAAVHVDNGSGAKLDYYLDVGLDYHATSCAGPTRTATISVRLDNAAPRHGLPAYVRYQGPGKTLSVESVPRNKEFVFIHATDGSALTGASLDGKPVQVSSGVERGHPVYGLDLTLAPDQPRTITLTLSEPVTKGQPQTMLQPLARPQRTVLDAPTCT